MIKLTKIFFFFHIFCLPILLFAQPNPWSEPVNVSNNAGSSGAPDMVVDDNQNLHLVWCDNTRLEEEFFMDILYSYYDRNVWSIPVQISAMDTTFSFDARVAVDSNCKPHVVWNHRAIYPDADIYYSTLTDSGWSEPLNLTPDLSTSLHPDIDIDSQDRIHVVWSTYTYGIYKAYHRICQNGIWLSSSMISDEPGSEIFTKITIDSEDNVHLTATSSGEIIYTKYDGQVWSNKINISNSPTFSSGYSCIDIDTCNNPNITWSESGGSQICNIYFSEWNGSQWSIPANLTNINEYVGWASFAISSNNVKIVLCEIFDHIYCLYQNNGIWSNPEILLEDYISSSSSIAVDSFNIIHATITSLIFPATPSEQLYLYNNQFMGIYNYDIKPKESNLRISCYPNPFNKNCKIYFTLNKETEARINIYNSLGQIIEILPQGILKLGTYFTIWDNKFDMNIASGIYFVELQTDNNFRPLQIIIQLK